MSIFESYSYVSSNSAGLAADKVHRLHKEPCSVSSEQGYYFLVSNAPCKALPALSDKMEACPDGYRMMKDSDCFIIQSASQRGLLYGINHAESLGDIPAGYCKEEIPQLKIRGAHLDVRYGFPTREKLKSIIDDLFDMRYNMLIIENENRLPFKRHPDIVAEEHFSEDDLKWLNEYAKERFIELSPLQQTFGHLEYLLIHPQYAPMREVREMPQNEPLFHYHHTGFYHYHNFDEVCPCCEESYKIVEDLLDETMAFFPDSKYIHIGCDEAWNLCYCDKCRQRFGENGKNKALVEHFNRISDYVLKAGRTPIVWADMLSHMSADELKQFNKDTVYMPWVYKNIPHDEQALENIKEANLTAIGAAAAKCYEQDLFRLDLPDYYGRFNNVNWWSDQCNKLGFDGFIVTIWSNYCGIIAPPHALFDTVWPIMFYAARKMWDGNADISYVQDNFIRDYFGVDEKLNNFNLDELYTKAQKVAETAVMHKSEAKLWLLAIVNAYYRQKSQHIIRELYRYDYPISKMERILLDRRSDEITRMREWLKEGLAKELSSYLSQREVQTYIDSRFKTDEIIFEQFKSKRELD